MAVQMIFLLLLSIVNAMQLDMSKVKSDSSLSVTVIQERLLDSWTLKLDKRDTLIRLYSLVSAVSHFDDTQFSLYLDERCLVASTCTVESAGINDMDVLLLKVIPSSPLEPTEQQSPEYPLGKVASADTILFSPRLRRSNPNLRMKSKSAGGEYCRTPRKRVNQSRVECFYLLPAEQQGMIREAFYEDIIRNEKLTIILENKYRELIETMFTDLPKFNEMLSPELMLEIDEIEDKLRASGQFIEMGEQALEVSNDDEEESEDFVSQVLHVMAMVNGHPIPVLLDCMVTEASMSFGAFFKIFGRNHEIPADCQLNLQLDFESVSVDASEINLVHDTEAWIQVGLEFMMDHGVVIDFGENEVRIKGHAIPFS